MTKICIACNTEYVPTGKNQRYCTAADCRRAVANRRNRVSRAAPRPPLTERLCALPECSQSFQPLRDIQKCCCEHHGQILNSRRGRERGLWLPTWDDAARDRYHRRRAQKAATATGRPPVIFADIAARDHWQCQLCGDPVDAAVAWPAAGSPSLDHIEPLSKGGTHELDNVQLAHLGCNIRKGNRTHERVILNGALAPRTTPLGLPVRA
jgi:hypothetical protein